MNDNLSPADLKAVVGDNNNGFNGDGSWLWIILILALCGGFGGSGGFGGIGALGGLGAFGGYGFDGMYPWLVNGQQDIIANTNNRFDNLQLGNQLTGIANGVQGLSTQLCNCCADMNQTVNAGFANAETAANSRQMANMQQAFSNQIATLQGFNGVTSQLCDASAENRLGQANLTATILSENCADRAALQEGIRDLLANQTSNTQRILDQLCADKIDAKNEKISDLQRQLQMADLKASQIEQNAFIAQGFSNEVDQLYNRLSSCPVPSTPVYGRTPIFTCNSNGCGCGSM